MLKISETLMWNRTNFVFSQTGIRTNLLRELGLKKVGIRPKMRRVGGNRSKERDRKSELVLRSTYQIFWMGSKQLGSKFLKRSQICSHTPSALNAGAKRSGATCHYGHASMLLLGEGSEATEPYNKYDKIRPHSIRSQQFDQKVRPLSFRPEKFDLFTATQMRNETQGENGVLSKGIISKVFQSIKRAFDISPFPLVPRGPLCSHLAKRGRTGAKT